MKINYHWLNRYYKFIDVIKLLGVRDLEYAEDHHIFPRCLGGSDSKDNIISLSLKEHFVAHWMLFNAYHSTSSIMSAFYQMCNKNPQVEYKKKHMKFERGVSARVYEKKKKEFYKLLSEIKTGWVHVTEAATGNKIKIRVEDFDRERYTFHTTGKFVCFDKIENKMVSVPCIDYHNDSRYVVLEGIFHFIDKETNEVIKMKKSIAKELNSQCGYNRYIQQVKISIGCFDKEKNKISISLNEYDSTQHQHQLKDKFVVFDSNQGKHVSISAENYDPAIHTTNTKGKVVAKDKNGKSFLASKEELLAGEVVGITKGLTTVKNNETGKFEQIKLEEFQANKQNYSGPCFGKVNVIERATGIRGQINKNEFDRNRYTSLSSLNQWFKAKNHLTNAIKNVSIYEWNKTISDLEWEPIDKELFEKRKALL